MDEYIHTHKPSGDSWDTMSVDDYTYVIRNDTIPSLYMRSDDLREGSNLKTGLLPPIMEGGEHYFGVHKKRYRILGNKLRYVTDLSDESGTFVDAKIDASSLGGSHYCARRINDQNYVYKVEHEVSGNKHIYSYTRYKGVSAFSKGTEDTKGTGVKVDWEIKAIWANGDNFYCILDDGTAVIRHKAGSMIDLLNGKGETSGMAPKVVTFLPGGFVHNSGLLDGEWVPLTFYIGGAYDEEISQQVGVDTELMVNLQAHYDVVETVTAKVSSAGMVSALAEASVKSTTKTSYGLALSATFSQSTSELKTVTKRFKGPVDENYSEDYYWSYVVKQKGLGTLSQGLGQTITHTPETPGIPGVQTKE